MKIIGISAFYHDSAAALVSDGEIISAYQEERFTRKKHDSDFPINSINQILNDNNLLLSDIDFICFYEKPILKFDRLIESYISIAPRGFKSFRSAMPIWLKEKIFLKKSILKSLQKIDQNFEESKIKFSEHHLSHASSAFYPSPFEEAIILTIDGVGEWCTSSIAIGKKNFIEIKKEIHFPHSLGLLYSAFTFYTGFKVNSGEYKLMGLAPYGEPKYEEIILNNLIDVKDDGSFHLNQKYFGYLSDLKMINKKFEALFQQKARKVDEELTQFHMDIASSIQSVLEKIILKIGLYCKEKYKIENICLAGGVALNCVANGKLLNSGIFEKIWIQPASGDAGGSLGAALALWYQELKKTRYPKSSDSMKGSYLGKKFSDGEIKNYLESCGAIFKEYSENTLLEETASLLNKNKAIGWFQGRMEFGPRALGSRSIISSPIPKDTQKKLNLKVKFRESFRPFAPAILREKLEQWFKIKVDSPYMLLVSEINDSHKILEDEISRNQFGIDRLNNPRSTVPAITHIDYSARIQTVHEDTNKKFHRLIKKYEALSGVPILVNTSFNVRGEPIVFKPKDAWNCFMGTDLDALVIGNFLLLKEKQDQNLLSRYEGKFELD